MEATRKLNFSNTSVFFLKVFFPVNISIQFSQALICVVFVDFVSKAFLHIDLLLYSLGGCYILFLAYKTLKSKKSNTLLELTFSNLAIVMLLSPKIWLLFPSGSVIANQLNQSVVINAFVFAFSMLAVSNLMFVLYVIIGKIGTKLLKDNFSYLTFSLLILFAFFLFYEASKLLLQIP
ncbi:hypothetical protein NQX30_03770 [Candidatus Persebacteraceae bacterium Df01]|jgi:threonine/homoserine/homoserine lactone efflux protein|uniref:LysE type translocator n=1 Tax=Candidatus Doriopsillibacter californiensis TaxID=2970740 RepID=A0ABT7QL93_9GAMM|nr:hypothetical protein [Candidatus Persebacteraceae bacterium Df01]